MKKLPAARPARLIEQAAGEPHPEGDFWLLGPRQYAAENRTKR